MEDDNYPHQGEIYLIRALKTIGDTKKRPAVVVSINVRNQLSSSVLVVPLTSDLTGGEIPTRILARSSRRRTLNRFSGLMGQYLGDSPNLSRTKSLWRNFASIPTTNSTGN